MASSTINQQAAIKLIECPRDAMQGWKHFIATEDKIKYINALLEVGFDTIDFGSFVSPKVISQMADTKDVINNLRLQENGTKLLAIVANKRGAAEAVKYDKITYLGYPFSISETFQLKNTNSTISQSIDTVKAMQQLCEENGKQLVIYISMGFGNPYGDPYDKEVVVRWVEKLTQLGVNIISLSDTVGVADPSTIAYLFSNLVPAFPQIEFGAHFHSGPHNWEEKIDAACRQGCKRFDSTIKGLGGCPMATEELVGNMVTENLVSYFEKNKLALTLDKKQLQNARKMADEVFIA